MAYDWSGETIREKRLERLTITAIAAIALAVALILALYLAGGGMK